MSLATNDGIGDNITTEWHRVVIFGKAAEAIQKYATKGTQLYVEGRIRTNKWQDDAGNNRYSTEIIANNFQFINGGNQDGNRPTPNFDNVPEAQQVSTPVNNDRTSREEFNLLYVGVTRAKKQLMLAKGTKNLINRIHTYITPKTVTEDNVTKSDSEAIEL